MLLRSLNLSKHEFETGTGWTLKPEGACQGPVCIPLSKPAADVVDVAQLAKDMAMRLRNSVSGRWGPLA